MPETEEGKRDMKRLAPFVIGSLDRQSYTYIYKLFKDYTEG